MKWFPVERADRGFVLELADGRREPARKIVLATGMEYRPPSLPGLAELWGGSVFHCPFCHGWEVQDQPLAVLARGDRWQCTRRCCCGTGAMTSCS